MADFAADFFSPPFAHFEGTQDSIPASLPQSFYVAPLILDTTAPVVSGVSPAPGSILPATDPVSFDITDDSGAFRRIVVMLTLGESGITEVVHDGTSFRGLYQLSSLRTPIINGFHFDIYRTGGWTSTPTLQIVGIDRSGNEV